MTARILIVDDHPLVIAGIRTVLERDPELEIVGDSHTGQGAIAAIARLRPDVVLLDVRLGDLDGSQVARAVLDSHPRTKIVMLTAFDDPSVLQSCLATGVSGILLKGSLNLDLAGALREVVRGGIVVDDTVTRALEHAAALLGTGATTTIAMRPREVEVLRLMAVGMTTRDVAVELHLSVNTVRSYTQALMEKLGAHTRVQAIVQARRLQLI